MTTFERIKQLARKKNKTLQTIATELGYGENYFYSLNAGKQPSAKRLSEIAKYFNVSVDYLLTGRDEPTKQNVEQTVEEALNTVMSFDGKPLTDHDREVMRGILEGYLRSKEGK